MSQQAENCENCGRVINKEESAQIFENRITCCECKRAILATRLIKTPWVKLLLVIFAGAFVANGASQFVLPRIFSKPVEMVSDPTYEGITLTRWLSLADDEDSKTQDNAFAALTYFPSEYNGKILPVFRRHLKSRSTAAAALYAKSPDEKDKDAAVNSIINEFNNGYVFSSVFKAAEVMYRRKKDRDRIMQAVDSYIKKNPFDAEHAADIKRSFQSAEAIWKD